MLSLDHSARHSTGPLFLPSEHPYLTAVHKNGLEPSQAPPTTVSPLQFLSYGVVQAMDYEEIISSSR